MIEQLTGRKVLAFLSHALVEPDLTIEMFLMDGVPSGAIKVNENTAVSIASTLIIGTSAASRAAHLPGFRAAHEQHTLKRDRP